MHSPPRRRILVTSALPYANGRIHLGHLVEYIQTDIFVRFQKLRGHECVYLCADDTHGTAIMIRARDEGRSERDLVAAMRDDHLADFAGFGVAFDHYGSTDSEANRRAMPKADYSKWPKPGELARVILFLSSDDARLISGAAIPVYGEG